jgi:hypothetical protein
MTVETVEGDASMTTMDAVEQPHARPMLALAVLHPVIQPYGP